MSISSRDEFRSGLGLPAGPKTVHSHAVLADARTAIEAEFAAACYRKASTCSDAHDAQTYYVVTGCSKRVLNALTTAGFNASAIIGLTPIVIAGDNVRATEAFALAGSFDATLGEACKSILTGLGDFAHLKDVNCGGVYEFDTVYYHQSEDHVQARNLVEAARNAHPRRSIIHGGTLMRDVAVPHHAAIIFGHGGFEAVQVTNGDENPTMVTYVGGNTVPYVCQSLVHVQRVAKSGIIVGTSRGIMSSYQWSYDDAPAENSHGARGDLLYPIVKFQTSADMQLRLLIVLSPTFEAKLAGFVYTLAKKANGEARNALVKYILSLYRDATGTADHYNCIGAPNPRAPFVVVDPDGTLSVREVANIIATHVMEKHNLCESGVIVFWANLQEKIMSNKRLAFIYNILYHVPWKRILKIFLNNLFPCGGILVDLDSRWSLMEALGAVCGAWKMRGGIICAILSKYFDVALPANLIKVFIAACGVFSATRKSFHPTLSTLFTGAPSVEVTPDMLEQYKQLTLERTKLVGVYAANLIPYVVELPLLCLTFVTGCVLSPILLLARKYLSPSNFTLALQFYNYAVNAPICEEVLKKFWKRFVGEAAGPLFGFFEHAVNDGPLLTESPNGYPKNAPVALLWRIAVHWGVSKPDNLAINMVLHSLLNIVIISLEKWLGQDIFHSRFVLSLTQEQKEFAIFKMFTLPEMGELMRELLLAFEDNVSRLGASIKLTNMTNLSCPRVVMALVGLGAFIYWLFSGEQKETAFTVREALVLNKRDQLFEGMRITFGRMYNTYIARKEKPSNREGFEVVVEGKDKDNLEPIIEGEKVGLDENPSGMLIAITPGIKVNWVGTTDYSSLLNSFDHRLRAPKYDGAFDEKLFNLLCKTHQFILQRWNDAIIKRLEGGVFTHNGVSYDLEVVDGCAKTRLLDPFGDEILGALEKMTSGMPARNKTRWNEAFQSEKAKGFLGSLGKVSFFNKVEPVIAKGDKAPRVVFNLVAEGVAMSSVQLRRAMEPYAKASQYTQIINASGLNGVELAVAMKEAMKISQSEYEFNVMEGMDQKERIARSLDIMVAGDDNLTFTAELNDEDTKFLLARHHLVAVHSKLFGRDLSGPSTATKITGPYHNDSDWTLDDATFCSNRLWPAMNGDQYIKVFGPKIFKVIQSMFLYKGKTQMQGGKLHQRVWPTVCGTRIAAIDDLIKHHSYNPLFVKVLNIVREFFTDLLSVCKTDKYQGDTNEMEFDRAEFEKQFKLRGDGAVLTQHDSILEKYVRIYGKPVQLIMADLDELQTALKCYSFNAAGELTGPVLPESFGKLVAIDCGMSSPQNGVIKLTNDQYLAIFKSPTAVKDVAAELSTSVDVIDQMVLAKEPRRKGTGRTKNNWLYDTFIAAVSASRVDATVVFFGVMLSSNVSSPQACTAIMQAAQLPNVKNVLVIDSFGASAFSMPQHPKIKCLNYLISSVSNGLVDGKTISDHPVLKHIVADLTVGKVFIASDIYCEKMPELQTEFPGLLKTGINSAFKKPVTVIGFKLNSWSVSCRLGNYPNVEPTLCPFSGPGSEFFYFASSSAKWSKRIIDDGYIRLKVVLPMKCALLMSSEAFVTAFGEPGVRLSGTRFTKEFDGTCWDTSYGAITMPPTVLSLKSIYINDSEIIKENMESLFDCTSTKQIASNKKTGMKIAVLLMMLSGIIYTSFGNGVANAAETILAWVLALCSDTTGTINWEAAEALVFALIQG